MSAAILPEFRLPHNAFGDQYTPNDIHDLVYHPGVVPPIPHSPTKAQLHVERKLGDTEASYFLPSRESGVNDMYLHIGCRAPPCLVERRRVLYVWAIMRLRHPLLAAKVRMDAYDDISFTYDAPRSPEQALELAAPSLEYREQTKDDLIDAYLNGPRTLSNERLSHLVVANSEPAPAAGADQNADFLICATHFLGDGMALHQFASDFFVLLGGALDQAGLAGMLVAEWRARCAGDMDLSLPSSIEDRLPPSPPGALRRLAERVDFDLNQQKLIGGHSFPRRSGLPRRTIVPTFSIEPEKTKAILGNCKAHGVSISAALFAVCNIAWARTHPAGRELPIMLYSALNMRPRLRADARAHASYWFLAIGYFNVVLPAFVPAAAARRVFWHRARAAKAQSAAAARSPTAVARCARMAAERGARARAWAREDDGGPAPAPAPALAPPVPARLRPRAPSAALMGLSLLGNLDGIYEHARFPAIKCHTLTTGSRQRAGGMLLFGYTFAERLWISFGYDENGFEESVVKLFWKNVGDVVEEFLVPA